MIVARWARGVEKGRMPLLLTVSVLKRENRVAGVGKPREKGFPTDLLCIGNVGM